jgi:hypothetical protein
MPDILLEPGEGPYRHAPSLPVLQVGSNVMMTILERAAPACWRQAVTCRPLRSSLIGSRPRIATLPLDLLRHDLFVTRTAASESMLIEIVDGLFLPLVRKVSAL